MLLAATGVATAQTGGTTGATGSTGGTSATSGSGPASALPSGGVPSAGTVGGIGTPPADVQGKPGLSTPGANKP